MPEDKKKKNYFPQNNLDLELLKSKEICQYGIYLTDVSSSNNLSCASLLSERVFVNSSNLLDNCSNLSCSSLRELSSRSTSFAKDCCVYKIIYIYIGKNQYQFKKSN